jgi:integrase
MLPKHVRAMKRPNGRVAYYWHPYRNTAKAGQPVRLPDDPIEMLKAVQELERGPRPKGGIQTMIEAYQASPKYRGLAEATRREYDRYMRTLAEAIGEHEPGELLPVHVAEFRDALGETPAKANAYVRAIAALYRWGRERGFASSNPAEAITKLAIGTHEPWPQWAWDLAIAGLREELKIACLLGRYTSQRLGDVLRMKLSDVGPDGIEVKQQKTGKVLTIPILAELAPVITEAKRRGRIFIVSRPDGSPFTVDQFHAMWGREMVKDGLKRIKAAGLSFHGLRKRFAVDAANAGASGKEIGSFTGQSLPVVEHYTKGADQKILARNLRRKLEGGRD